MRGTMVENVAFRSEQNKTHSHIYRHFFNSDVLRLKKLPGICDIFYILLQMAEGG